MIKRIISIWVFSIFIIFSRNEGISAGFHPSIPIIKDIANNSSLAPTIKISTNQSYYTVGDILTLSLSITNPGDKRQIDLFLGFKLPDESLYFFNPSLALIPANITAPSSFIPTISALELKENFSLLNQVIYELRLPVIPSGDYIAFAFFAEPGSVQVGAIQLVGDVGLAKFSFAQYGTGSSNNWYDLASKYRQHVTITGNPQKWFYEIKLFFPRGHIGSADEIIVAAKHPIPFEIDEYSAYEDGSIMSATLIVPTSNTFDRDFLAEIDIYYGGIKGGYSTDLVSWDEGTRVIKTPFYQLQFDDYGVIRSMKYKNVGIEILSLDYGAFTDTYNKKEGWHGSLLTKPSISVIEDVPPYVSLYLSKTTSSNIQIDKIYTFYPSFFTMDYQITVGTEISKVIPLRVWHASSSGYVITPNEMVDAVDGIGGDSLSLASSLPFDGYMLSSQSGYVILGFNTNVGFDNFEHYDTTGEYGASGIGYSSLSPNQTVSGTIYLIPTPYSGAYNLDLARSYKDYFSTSHNYSLEMEREEARPDLFIQRDQWDIDNNGYQDLILWVDNYTSVALQNENGFHYGLYINDGYRMRKILEVDPMYQIENGTRISSSSPAATASFDGHTLKMEGVLSGPNGQYWRVESQFFPRMIDGTIIFEEVRAYFHIGDSSSSIRFVNLVSTDICHPTWDSNNTIVIPGQFYKTNYHPDHFHGGGPKWGPSDYPVGDEKDKFNTGGHANHWVFPSSRLPLPFVAAIDGDHNLLAFVGAYPTSPLGENSVGFYAYEGEKVRLTIQTPTTYEPWIPTGYSSFARQPRYDTYVSQPGESLRWNIVYSGRITTNLNAWGRYAQALYGLIAGYRGNPYKMTLKEGVTKIARSLYNNFYKPRDNIFSYGTGPKAQWTPLGFTGGAHVALASMLAGKLLDNTLWYNTGLAVLDNIAWAFNNGPEFPYLGYNKGWHSASGEPGYVIMTALYALQKAYKEEFKRGKEHINWYEAIVRCSDAWVDHQRADGSYPHKSEAMGEYEDDYDSTNIEAGVMAGLVETYRLTGDKRYLSSAEEAAHYYAGWLRKGFLYGGPGDIEALVNSEVPMWYLHGFLELYLETQNQEYLTYAMESADWRLSFQFAHQWPVAAGSELYIQGWSGLGSEAASPANVHSVSYGVFNIEDYSNLYSITKDKYYLERALDLTEYTVQQFGRFDGDILPEGLGVESFWATDSLWDKGNISPIDPDTGYMSWVTGWAAIGASMALEKGMDTN